MTSIDDVFKGAFLTTDSGIEEGDTVKIIDTPQVDDTTFEDRTYIILPVDWNGIKYSVRIGASNANNIANDFGTKEIEEWKDREIYVKEIRLYKGLGKSGIIWGGISENTIVCPNCKTVFNKKVLERTNGHCPNCDAEIEIKQTKLE